MCTQQKTASPNSKLYAVHGQAIWVSQQTAAQDNAVCFSPFNMRRVKNTLHSYVSRADAHCISLCHVLLAHALWLITWSVYSIVSCQVKLSSADRPHHYSVYTLHCMCVFQRRSNEKSHLPERKMVSTQCHVTSFTCQIYQALPPLFCRGIKGHYCIQRR